MTYKGVVQNTPCIKTDHENDYAEFSYDELMQYLQKQANTSLLCNSPSLTLSIPFEVCEHIISDFMDVKCALREYGFLEGSDAFKFWDIVKSNIVLQETDNNVGTNKDSSMEEGPIVECSDVILPYEEKCIYER